MRILDVSPRVSYPPERGSNVRAAALLDRLAIRHDVRAFAQARLGTPGGLHGCEWRHDNPLACLLTEAAVRGWPAAPLPAGTALRLTRPSRLRRLLSWADVALVEFPWQFAACRAAGTRGPLVLAAHNVEAEKFRSYADALGISSLRARPWLKAIDRMETVAVRGADLVLAVSQADRAGLCARYDVDPARVVVVPNGAELRKRGSATAAREDLGLPAKPVVLFAGADVPPNRVGLSWVREVAMRCPELTFVVVGRVAEPGRAGNLVCTGLVESMGPYLDAADVAICPIAYGGGTKVKLLEAMGAGIPVVAFEHSAGGIGACDGEDLLVAEEDADALATALRRLARDRDLARRIGAAGRALVAEEFDWDRIALRLEAALGQLVPASSSAQSVSSSVAAAG